MSLSIYQASIPVFVKSLTALSAILDKAAAKCAEKKIDPNAYLTARLAPDMFAFTRQVQITADFAKNTAARLAGREPPKYADEEKTFDELKARIAKTLDFVKGFKAADIDAAAGRTITIPLGGAPTSFTGPEYLLTFALPNFFFHCTTAYDILRHNGLEIGKRDFLGRT